MGNKKSKQIKPKRNVDDTMANNNEKPLPIEHENLMASLKGIINPQGYIPLSEERIKLLIYGYIREWNKQIPNDLIQKFIHFYPLGEIKFNTEKCGWNLDFQKNDTVLKIKSSVFAYPSAVLNTVITNKMCKQFEIQYLVQHTCQFLAGFGYIPIQSFEDYDWHDGFGKRHVRNGGANDYSKGIYVMQACQQLSVAYRGNWGAEGLNHAPLNSFESGDIVKLLYDFENDKFSMYYKDKCVDGTSLNGHKNIIPGVCLSSDYITIEIIKCKFY
eukprot:291245_1